MKKSRLLMVLLAVILVSAVFVFSGCSGGENDDKGVSGSVGGIVTDSTTGNPIEGVTVTLGTQTTQTNAKGIYAFTTVPEGELNITGVMEGYVDYSSTITVYVGEVTRKDFQMVSEASLVGKVTGKVTNAADGKAVAGATVSIDDINATTGEDGVYTLSNVPVKGIKTITTIAPGQQEYTGEVDVTTGETIVKDIEMNPFAGRYQVYNSEAGNLVDGVDTGYNQIYMYDHFTGATTLVSVGFDGTPSNGECNSAERASISENGRYVIFDTNATNVVDLEFQGDRQIYVRDMKENVTTLVSMGNDGKMGDYCSKMSSISADGSYIVYASNASNIITGAGGGGYRQIFLYETATGNTSLVSLGFDGVSQGNDCSRQPFISGDGKFVAFQSEATNLVDGFGDGSREIYVRNLETGVTSLVSIGYDGNISDGCCGAPTVSSGGRYVAFHSYDATNLVNGASNGYSQVYMRDMQDGLTTLISVGYDGNPSNNSANLPNITPDGKFLVFSSKGTNMVEGIDNGHRNIFLRDLTANTTSVLSLGFDGSQSDNCSNHPFISADGKFVYFDSYAQNLIDGTTDTYRQVYAREIATGVNTKISVNSQGEEGNSDSWMKECD